MSSSLFFSFDGLDGVGKSTQMELFCKWLADRGAEVVTCRDPGSTPLGEQIRGILLASDESTPIDSRSEMLLYMAARAQLVEEVIRPALLAGKSVVSDRFLLANVVYQGYAGGLDVEAVRRVGTVATNGILPDCTFLLDMPPDLAFNRLDRQLDRVESRGSDYRERLRVGFLAEAERASQSIHVVDADRSIDAIQQELRTIATGLLEYRAH